MDFSDIYCGLAERVIPRLPDASIDLVVTSPPYCRQRAKYYRSIPESEYPGWITGIMSALKPKLKPHGSVFITVRPHVRDGEISDYVLKSRLAIRASGWKECEELIWAKRDGPPIGSLYRPRRAYESVLWYSPTAKPFVNLKACGRESDRLGWKGAAKSHLNHDGQNLQLKTGRARITDVIDVPVSTSTPVRSGHTAVFPAGLPRLLIQSFSRPGGVVCDPFSGSATTVVEAMKLGRQYISIDSDPYWARYAYDRLRLLKPRG